MRRIVLPLVALQVAACGAAAVGAEAPAADPLDPRRLFPLVQGNVWSYDVDTGEGVPTLGITRVVGREGVRVEMSSGDASFVYLLRDDGIALPPPDGWLLRAPIAAGAEWPSAAGRTARVVEVGVRATVPAGTFVGCVVVEESGGDRAIRTTFCPTVGPVAIDSSMELAAAARRVSVSARLRGYELVPQE